MARSRNLKPGFFTNDKLAEVEPLGRLLFAGLWTIADREGRLDDRPKKIKVHVLPYDDCDVDDLLNELMIRGFIIRYSFEENDYIQIVNWKKHQNPHVKEQGSEIPAPDKHHTNTIQEQDKNGSCRADSLSLDSLNPIKPLAQNFARFWESYPKKKSKNSALKAFQKINPDQQLLETILSKIELAKKSPDWLKDRGQFIPYPASWLNAHGWEDEFEISNVRRLAL